MLKKSITTAGVISVVLGLSACSQKEDKAATTTSASATTTTTTTSTTTTAATPAVVASQVNVTVPASAAATTVASTTTTTTPAAAEKAANSVASSPATNATAATPNLALKADLTQLFRTLNELDRNTQAKQAEMAKKMQSAKTPADQQAFFKEVVTQLDLQKATLNKLKFNDPRVAQTRDKMVESINNSREGTAALIKKPNATPDTNPEIAKSMEKAQKSAEEARAMLMKLTDEAGIKPKSAEAAPTKK